MIQVKANGFQIGKLGPAEPREMILSARKGPVTPLVYALATRILPADSHRVKVTPVALIERAHSQKLKLCETLVEIADSLPGQVDPLKCLGVANVLVPLMRDVHRFEEDVLFPAWAAAAGGRNGALRRLLTEHVEEEFLADDVTETLLTLAHGGTAGPPEAVGSTLRGLPETMRRHIVFERRHVLPSVGSIEPSSNAFLRNLE